MATYIISCGHIYNYQWLMGLLDRKTSVLQINKSLKSGNYVNETLCTILNFDPKHNN